MAATWPLEDAHIKAVKPLDWAVCGGTLALHAHCALLLDYVPPEEPLGTPPLETPLELGDPNWTGGDLEGDLPGSCGMVKDQRPLGENLTVCWAAEMSGNQVASLNLGWQRRWTPSCIADSPLSTHLSSIPSGGVRLQPSQPPW